MFPSKRSSAAGVLSQPTSCSAAEISGNQDLMTEILLRLPIKSLIRFKSVSKQWLSLISDPRFCLVHGSGSPCRTSGLLLDRRRSTFGFINLDLSSSGSAEPPFKTLDFRVVQSCNGLLLCSAEKNVKRSECVVYNPTTSRFSSKLPPISGDISGIALAFEPSRSPHYKLICVMASQFRISIYSSETDRWKTIDRAFGLESSEMAFENGVYWNGSLHWIGVWDMAMSFDVDDETMGLFPMPPLPGEFIDFAFMRRYFGESRGYLHLVDQLDVLHSPRLHIHEMESDYSQWTLKFQVSLSHIPGSFPQIVQPGAHGFAFSVLCVIRGGAGDDRRSYLVLQIPGKVLRYNLETGTFFKLRDLESGCRDHPLALLKWTEVHQFVESLAPVV